MKKVVQNKMNFGSLPLSGFFRYKRIINQMSCLKLTWQACVMWSCNIIGCRLFFLVFVFTGQGALRRPVYILDKVHLEGFHLLTLATSKKKLTVSKAWIRFTSILWTMTHTVTNIKVTKHLKKKFPNNLSSPSDFRKGEWVIFGRWQVKIGTC